MNPQRFFSCMSVRQSIYLSDETLADLARRLAALPSASGRRAMPSQRVAVKALLRAHARLIAAADPDELLPAARWLIEHMPRLSEAAARTVADVMRVPKLPACATGVYKQLPRIYAIASEIALHSDARLSTERIVCFLDAYQAIAPLTIAELWALPLMLRIVSFTMLGGMAQTVAAAQQRRLAADRWLEHMAADGFPAARMTDIPRDAPFIERCAARLREDDALSVEPLMRLRGALHEREMVLERVIDGEHRMQARNGMLAGNAIESLHWLDALDWAPVFEALSPVDRVLAGDPAGVYGKMDFASRERMRAAVCDMARLADVSEPQVARMAVSCANDASVSPDEQVSPRMRHVGWYLCDGGITGLWASLGGAPACVRAGLLAKKHARGLFLAAHAVIGYALTLALSLPVAHAWLADGAGTAAALGIGTLAGTLLAVPVQSLLMWLSSRVIARLITPQKLFRLDLDAFPSSTKAAIVVPALITSCMQALHAVQNLEKTYFANRLPNLHFGLIGDFAEADGRFCEGDDVIVQAAQQAIDTLNARHGERFFFLHRPRVFSGEKSGGVWRGWERKRGALIQFNRWLLTGDGDFIAAPSHERLSGVTHVITLDADTTLPPGGAQLLLGAALHPLNRPEIIDGKRIGPAVIAPRVAVPLSGINTTLQALFSGERGTDGYNGTISDMYQDLCGEGIFSGKGIYDVAAFQSATADAFPENAILSHDLIEGLYAGAALAGDVQVFDAHPATVRGWALRRHRWMRGDWQLLPWLFSFVPGRRERRVPTRLTVFDCFKLYDNLRRSLIAPSCVACVLAGCMTGHSLIGVLALLLCFLEYSPVLWRCWRSDRRADAVLAIKRLGAQLALLSFDAVLSLDAILRTLSRLATRKRLLEWTTAADAECGGGKRENRLMRRCKAWGSLLGVVLTVSCVLRAFSGDFACLAFLPLGIDWMATAAIQAWLERPIARTKRFSDEEAAFLRELAQKTWHCFEQLVTPEDLHLPPDNLQIDPHRGLMRRTSPTNIGMYLISCCAAWKLSLIDPSTLTQRLEATTDTLETLPHWHGHLYNWISTVDGTALSPRYVSSVDSGNFVACLWTTASMLDDAASQMQAGNIMLTARLHKLSERLLALTNRTNFKPLYDEKRRLFSIGYDVEHCELTAAHYDLLASESRLLSLVAIARGDVPVKHFAALGRPIGQADGGAALLSWSGTMFEYLLPSLFLREPRGSLLGASCAAAVATQRTIQRSKAQDLPWGISESGYHAFDLQLHYQYHAFGCRDLALKGGLTEDVVIAPYASVMALAYAPDEVLSNLRRMHELGWCSPLGFYEAADATPARADGAPWKLVKSHMSHHQGMILGSLCNALADNAIQNAMMRVPGIAAHAMLLEERMPSMRRLPARRLAPPTRLAPRRLSYAVPFNAALPETHLLAGGGTLLVSTANGPAMLSWEGVLANRFRGDALDDRWGLNVVMRDEETGECWPIIGRSMPGASREAVFEPERAVWRTQSAGMTCELCACVSPEDGALVMRLDVRNRSDRMRRLSVVSFFESCMASPEADSAHPAFGNLFIEAQAIPEHGTLVLMRRPRQGGEKLCLLHTISADDGDASSFACEARREVFYGRLSDAPCMRMTGVPGAVIDPCSAVCRSVEVARDGGTGLSIVISFADSAAAAMRVAAERTGSAYAMRAASLAAAYAQVAHGFLRMTRRAYRTWNRAAAWALFSGLPIGTQKAHLLENRLPIRMLWRLGISGDLPIIVARVREAAHLPAAREVIRMHEFWRVNGLTADLGLLHEGENDYHQPLRSVLIEAISHTATDSSAARPGGVWMIDGKDITDEERRLLLASACLLFEGGEPPADHITRLARPSELPAPFVPSKLTPNRSHTQTRSIFTPPRIVMSMGIGGFTERGYRIPAGTRTPMPWCNVLANPCFGTLVSESGLGFTWHNNAHEGRLTPWLNDPIADPPGEWLALRDEETGETLNLLRDSTGGVEHMPGASIYCTQAIGLGVETAVFVHAVQPIKCMSVTLINASHEERRLSLLYCAQWVLGTQRERHARAVVRGFEADASLLWATGPAMDGVAWTACPGRRVEASGDRLEVTRDAYTKRQGLSGRTGAGLDACGALRASLSLPPGQTVRVAFLLGHSATLEDAVRNVADFSADEALRTVLSAWEERLGKLCVLTPDPIITAMASRWLPYQTLSSRFWARAGFYQAGGAIGFRDQLQDCLLLVYYEPKLVREHLLMCAAHQFEEGDVQHWWHPPRLGVRTRISDDLLWLPYVLCDYVAITGDTGILDEVVPYLSAPPLKPGQEDAFMTPDISNRSDTLLQHALLAIDTACRFGEHGLPLIGGGDWNDAMNRVGIEGRGESVWLGWFLVGVIGRMASLLRSLGRDADGERLMQTASALTNALETHAWDGEWYRRAFDDDGGIIGSQACMEAQIDCIAQSWAVISGAADSRRARIAMRSMETHLWMKNEGLLRLLSPPFDDGPSAPGYIKGYVPGVRENGGQYTHAAAWAVMAYAMLGDAERAYALFSQLMPATHADTPEKCAVYRLEPYAVAADIYAEPPNTGRGGWSWYTGSSAWLGRILIEWMMGYRREGERVTMTPCMPAAWREVSVCITAGASRWKLTARGSGEVLRVSVDGTDHADAWVKTFDDGKEHEVVFERRRAYARIGG